MNQLDKKYDWHFQRIGGLDQVLLTRESDLRNLKELDPKLWVALSCPAESLEFDQRTLTLLDADLDGHIRLPEVLDATSWMCERLKSLEGLMNASDTLPLNMIDETNEDGKKLLATAQAILKGNGEGERGFLTEKDVVQASKEASQATFNGDGVFPPSADLEDEIKLFIQDALTVIGGVKDISNAPGINQAIAEAFLQTLTNRQKWRAGLKSATSVLKDDTPQAWGLMDALKSKIDDYFLRVDLASYAPQAQSSLNVDEKCLISAQNGVLESKALAELPLSKIEAQASLNLFSGINPVWREQVERFAELVRPLLTNPDVMSRQDWLHIQKELDAYAQTVKSQPEPVAVDVTISPTLSIDKLSKERIDAILQSDVLKRFKALVKKDMQTPVAAADIAALERLVIYQKYLYRLLMNFVTFKDFFDLNRGSSAFQAGELYIDGRRCDLCILVKNVEQHILLANYSELFLLYCECTRKAKNGEDLERKTIVAAVTMGSSDLLVEGRNGFFLDKQGRDWDARVIKVIMKPISIRQAILTPYKRIGKLITDQLNKWASAKDDQFTQAGASKLESISSAPTASAIAPKFDIGRNVGIFAAIGLALGALGTAIASIASALFGLQWWQFPILLFGIFLLISGPSVVLAWLKLRQRTLGPLLEASGWAVNGRIKINYALGDQLTSLAILPANSKRNLIDPLKDKRKLSVMVILVIMLLGIFGIVGWEYWKLKVDQFQASPALSEEITEQQS